MKEFTQDKGSTEGDDRRWSNEAVEGGLGEMAGIIKGIRKEKVRNSESGKMRKAQVLL